MTYYVMFNNGTFSFVFLSILGPNIKLLMIESEKQQHHDVSLLESFNGRNYTLKLIKSIAKFYKP